MRQLLDSVRSIGKSQGPRLVALFGCMYYGMLRPSEAVSLRLDECELPASGWGRLEFREVHSAAGREWTDDGQVHEARKPKGGPKNSVPRVPIPPELVRLLREHVESYGTAPDGRLFWTYRGGIYQPSTLWQVLRKARTVAFPPVVVASPLARKPYDFRHAGVSWRLNAGAPARRWPSGQVTASKCSTESTRTASMGTMNAGTSRWRTSLASLEAWHVCRNLAVSPAELGGWLPGSFRVYSGIGDMGRLLVAYGCTAVQ
jgi:integrase